jgi:hypothetical protein
MALDSANDTTPRRMHRTLAVYLAMYAWVKNLDCVVIDGHDLRRYLGDMSRLEKPRKWAIMEDVKALFPHAQYIRRVGATPILFLSRTEIPDAAWKGRLYLGERIERFRELGIRADTVYLPKEEEIVALNAKVIHGIEDFAPLERAWRQAGGR